MSVSVSLRSPHTACNIKLQCVRRERVRLSYAVHGAHGCTVRGTLKILRTGLYEVHAQYEPPTTDYMFASSLREASCAAWSPNALTILSFFLQAEVKNNDLVKHCKLCRPETVKLVHPVLRSEVS
eukprot:5275109-Amphidinium_carterae.1